jgi:DNA polymerase I-like protein with 3'-5' exonuclease and polymerase domains
MFDFKAALEKMTTFPKKARRCLGFDFETTGVHLHHESQPFMLSITYDTGECYLWEADIDPFTRNCSWSKEDQMEIAAHFEDAETMLIGSNSKFDVRCLSKVIECDPVEILTRCHDTIMQHHRLNNQERHGLKEAAVKYAGIEDSDESDLIAAVKDARTIGKKLGFAIASKTSCPQQTKAPIKGWGVMDYWLPKAVAKWNWEHSDACRIFSNFINADSSSDAYKANLLLAKRAKGWEWRPPHLGGKHPWWTLCAKYCQTDTLRTVLLYQEFTEALEADNGTAHYLDNRTALPISYATEERGVTFSIPKAKNLITKFEQDKMNAQFALQYAIGAPTPFNPNSGKTIQHYLYTYFMQPVNHWTSPKKEGSRPQPSTDADAIIEIANTYMPPDPREWDPPKWDKDVEPYIDFKRRIKAWGKMLIEEGAPSYEQLFAFCSALLTYKQAETAVRYLKGYLHAALIHPLYPDVGILHPSLNPVGTKSVRYSGSQPNPQNISKGGKIKKGTEWLKKEERSLRSVFGPAPGREWWTIDYSQIQPVIFAMCCGDKDFAAAMERGEDPYLFVARKIYAVPDDQEPEKYQRDNAKTVLLAFLFGAGEAKLKAASGVAGIYALLKDKMPSVLDFMQQIEHQIRNYGFVFTPGRYKLYIDKPHKGVNYICQGGEGEIVKRAQYGIQTYLDQMTEPGKMFMTLYVHDELVFDCEQGYGRHHIGNILRIMLDAAKSFGIPCKASVKFVGTDWASGQKVQVI